LVFRILAYQCCLATTQIGLSLLQVLQGLSRPMKAITSLPARQTESLAAAFFVRGESQRCGSACREENEVLPLTRPQCSVVSESDGAATLRCSCRNRLQPATGLWYQCNLTLVDAMVLRRRIPPCGRPCRAEVYMTSKQLEAVLRVHWGSRFLPCYAGYTGRSDAFKGMACARQSKVIG